MNVYIGTSGELKNAYIGEVYEYSYDFRGKTWAQCQADGWGTATGDGGGLTCGNDGLQTASEPGRPLINLNYSLSNAKKIKIITQFYKTTTSIGVAFGMCTNNSRANNTSLWIDNGGQNYSSISIAGTGTSINPTYSGNLYKVEYELDLENKLATVTFLIGSTFTTNITITDAQVNTIRNNSLYLFGTVGSGKYLQAIDFIVE